MSRYTTLLEDNTDTFYQAPVLLGYLLRVSSKKEHFSDGITTSGLTVGNSSSDGFVQFIPSSSTADSYLLQNTNGVLSLIRNQDQPVLNVSDTGVVLSPLQMSSDVNDTTELVPILVDQNGKLYRGHSLFQTIAQLQDRIQTLEQAGSIQIEDRLSQAEVLLQRIRNRYNALQIDNSAI